jgi:hypothetical protein
MVLSVAGSRRRLWIITLRCSRSDTPNDCSVASSSVSSSMPCTSRATKFFRYLPHPIDSSQTRMSEPVVNGGGGRRRSDGRQHDEAQAHSRQLRAAGLCGQPRRRRRQARIASAYSSVEWQQTRRALQRQQLRALASEPARDLVQKPLACIDRQDSPATVLAGRCSRK